LPTCFQTNRLAGKGQTMKIIKNILIAALLFFISGSVINAQEVQVNTDTSRVKLQQKEQQQEQQQTQSQEQAGSENRNGRQNQTGKENQANTEAQNQSGQSAQAGNQSQANSNRQAGAQGANTTGVKKIQSARPDWSKARGARPASVERPSGSRIPKGAGKPAGAKGPGRR